MMELNNSSAIDAAGSDAMGGSVIKSGPHAGHHHPPGQPLPPAAVWVFVVALVSSQLGLYIWRKRHPKSYNIASLAGLFLTPVAFSLYSFYWRFVLLWLAFAAATGYFVRLARQKPLAVTTPKRVYQWFWGVHRVCYALGLGGYLLAVVQSMAGPIMAGTEGLAFLAIFYGLYFGVLGRDVAENCAETMSTTLGYCKKDDDYRQRAPPPNICALCGEELRGLEDVETEEGYYDEDEQQESPLCTLNCGHTLHNFCIMGWTIVGKKDTCPFCGEKVSLSTIAGSSPWKKQSVAWSWLLGMVRYLLSWHPLFVFVLHIIFVIFGLTDQG